MRQSQLIMNGFVHSSLQEPADVAKSLFEIMEKWRWNVWQRPVHQRTFVWDDAKVQAWIDRLALATQQRHRKPVGVIVTYQIDNGQESPIYVNDGSQRLEATQRVRDDPERFGYDPQTVASIIDSLNILVQHRWYQSQDEAVEDFQLLNMGTSLTPREMCQGILVNADQYVTWKPLFENVHEVMASVGGGLVQGHPEDRHSLQKRRQMHKYERHNFSLIVRWLSKESLVDYRGVASAELRKAQLDRKESIEHILRAACERYTSTDLRREVGMLVAHIHRQTATIRDIWKSIAHDDGRCLSPTLFRWLIDVSIWVRQSDTSQATWEDFITKLLAKTYGTSIVQDPNDIRNRNTLALGSVAKLKGVCAIIESDMYLGKTRRTQVRTPKLQGYDDSHIDPFSTNGNGPTVPEPASRNRARGAKPIEQKAE